MSFVHANGLRFAYLEEGRGPLVLLLHGFPDSAHTWDRTMRELAAAGYRAVAPFMRGYHPTEIAGPYDSDTLGRDALALIAALGASQAIVVGHDWGASAAYSAAALGPGHVKLLVTMAVPHPRALPVSPSLAWGMRHFFRLRRPGAAAAIRAGQMRYIDELWARWSPAWKQIPASETAPAKESLSQPGSLEAACAYYATMIPTLTKIRPALPPGLTRPITVPAVAFAGEHDGLMKPRLFEKARLCFESSYEVVQVPGGHFMHREHPDEFVGELVRVIKDHEARQTAAG